jgi:hypothetical protein
MGFKAFSTHAVEEIQEGFNDLSMSFDVELLYLVNRAGYIIREVGCVWIDSGMP